jgi:hypothetical protein
MRQSIIRYVTVLLLGLWLTACSTPTQGPTTWLDRPLDGDKVPLEPLTIQAHASDADGVARFEFFVSEALLATEPGGGGRFGDAQVRWTPSVPGMYLVRARALDNQGNIGPDAISYITVGELITTPTPVPLVTGSPTPTPVVTIPPTPTPAVTIPPTPTPVVTIPPTPTPVMTIPPTPTPPPVCPGAPVLAFFTANPSTITAGQSSTLSWGKVDNATSAVIDQGIGGIATPGSMTVSPGTTTTYTLIASGCSGTTTKKVTVIVSAVPPPPPVITLLPLDTTPPSISNATANPTLILKQGPGCPTYSRTTTVTATVTDAGGVNRVVARWGIGPDGGEVAMHLVGGNVYQAVVGPVNNTGNLSILVWARDQAGNVSQVGPLNVQVQECIG